MSNSDIEKPDLISKSRSDDLKIINYCNKYPNDDACQCVLVNSEINLYEINLFSSRYCWFQPCLENDTFKTQIISAYQKYCNNVLCTISLKDITIDGNGSISVTNNCYSAKISNTTTSISQDLLNYTDDSSIKQWKSYFFPNTNSFLIFGLLSSLLLL